MTRSWSRRVLRRHSLERRLFGWLLALLLVPALLTVSISLYVGSRSVAWIGTLGPWDQVAESGRALFRAAAPVAERDSALDAALRTHQRELSTSVIQARRWSFLGERVVAVLPVAFGALLLLLAAAALLISRLLARELARPIRELVALTERLGAGEPLPPEQAAERREVAEVHTLRSALRDAAQRIAEARVRELEGERVRAWGEMARRVAHEMKNPLTPLRLAIHRIRGAAGEDECLREPVSVLEEESARREELARQFAVLGRPSAGHMSAIDVRELLQSLLDTDVPRHIAATVHADPGLPLLDGHYDALQRAFRNLVRNAVEAINVRAPDGGRDAAGGAAVGGGTLRVSLRHERGSLVVVVADDGCGIPAAQVERIFEPDFTLKAGGTGLGLAVVRQAVLAHGGSVAARNRPEGGAEFEVRLPVRRARNLPRAGADPSASAAVSTGTAHDEPGKVGKR